MMWLPVAALFTMGDNDDRSVAYPLVMVSVACISTTGQDWPLPGDIVVVVVVVTCPETNKWEFKKNKSNLYYYFDKLPIQVGCADHTPFVHVIRELPAIIYGAIHT